MVFGDLIWSLAHFRPAGLFQVFHDFSKAQTYLASVTRCPKRPLQLAEPTK